MSETEEQLRKILGQEHEPLLDEVLGEALELKAESVLVGEENRAAIETRAYKAERSLAALGVAVGRLLPWARWQATRSVHDEVHASASAPDGKAVTLGDIRALLAAHEGECGTHESHQWRGKGPLTLTLEEVNQAMDLELPGLTYLQRHMFRARLVSILAQKGAGRGE